MLVLKHVEYPNHSEHWSELDDGRIRITDYNPDRYPQASVQTISRKIALKDLKQLLRDGYIMMVNNLFTNEELA